MFANVDLANKWAYCLIEKEDGSTYGSASNMLLTSAIGTGWPGE